MAFNVGNFVKGSAKTIVDRIVDRVIENVVSGLPSSARLTAKSTADSLVATGASYQSVEAFSAIKTDNTASGASDNFFGLAGRDTKRNASAPISKLRRTSTKDAETYLSKVNPSTKIASKRRDSGIDITVVV